eukprot:8886959-Heterocapsa_arctica.AAC.1
MYGDHVRNVNRTRSGDQLNGHRGLTGTPPPSTSTTAPGPYRKALIAQGPHTIADTADSLDTLP